MKSHSKSKLLAFRQCPKRLWLEVHRPDLREDSAAFQAAFKVGHAVGAIAQRLYDPKGAGTILDPPAGHTAALQRTTELLAAARPIFEAGFAAAGAIAYADVLLPRKKNGQRVWRMVEVKSSTEVKDYHRDDTAVQAFVARQAKLPLASIAVAHIDSKWVYPGGEQYDGLLVEQDLTAEVFGRGAEVQAWIADAQKVLAKKKEPALGTGRHCDDPFECGFKGYCQSQEPQAKYPVGWLPRVQTKALKSLLEDGSVTDLRQVPDELLNETQRRVKAHSLSGMTYFDHKGAAADLARHSLPAYFLDFETIFFAVPIWKGTRPYQQIPFQFSLHRLSKTGKLTHSMHLDLSGGDPSANLAKALVEACGQTGPVFVYNAQFEKSRIKELAARYKAQSAALHAINERIVDLLPVAQDRYYHPDQAGSWSIKSVLPTIANMNYDELGGVQDGGMAMEAFVEAVASQTTPERKKQLDTELRAYCTLDTLAMVKLWQFLSGRKALKL